MDDDARDGSVRRWLPARLAVVAVVVALALVVALVARPPAPVAIETYPGLPAGADVSPETFEPGWVVDERARRVAVYAAGSSACPLVARDVRADGDVVTVTLAPQERGACTDDLTWTTSVVAVPDEVDLERLEVDLVLER